jgi:hypothetical protein
LINFPNPFNPITTIEFNLPNSENTSLKVFDMLGKEVATLVTSNLQAGVHRYQFDGRRLASGIYYYQLKAGTFVKANKMILMR